MESMTFWDYLKLVGKDPRITRNARRRIYDMILSYGTRKFTSLKEEITHYNFFDADFSPEDRIMGIEIPLMELMNNIRAAAFNYGQAKRIFLLHGPVGSAKSTICRLLKKGLEVYSLNDEGAKYTIHWIADKDDSEALELLGGEESLPCPLNDEPLRLLPEEDGLREKMLKLVRPDLHIRGSSNPLNRFLLRKFTERYNGDMRKAIENHVRIKRVIFSEKDRIGIGTFQPRDEKDQDSTELTGDIDYKKLSQFGSQHDPRAFDYRYGEFYAANGGMLEFIEMLKLGTAFLYDLLSATQERNVKSKGFGLIDLDLFIIGHTNNEEYKRLKENEFMKALRDRTDKIDVPYNLSLGHEISIQERDLDISVREGVKVARKFSEEKEKAGHVFISPHTIEVGSAFGVLTRLEPGTKGFKSIELITKLRLYDGETVGGYNEDTVKEMVLLAKEEGMRGVSPRFVLDCIGNILASEGAQKERQVSGYMLIREIKRQLRNSPLLLESEIQNFMDHIIPVTEVELERRLKKDVREAIIHDPESLKTLWNTYVQNVKAVVGGEKVVNKYTGQDEEPDEKLMRSIEEKVDISESAKTDFRSSVMTSIGARAIDGKKFDVTSNEELYKALQDKLFEDAKYSIKWSSTVSSNIDDESTRKLDAARQYLVEKKGYHPRAAQDVLDHIGSIFAHGEKNREE
jgi:serine protein kinase